MVRSVRPTERSQSLPRSLWLTSGGFVRVALLGSDITFSVKVGSHYVLETRWAHPGTASDVIIPIGNTFVQISLCL